MKEGAVPAGTGLAQHISRVTRAGGTPVQWDSWTMGLDLLGAARRSSTSVSAA